MVRLVTLALIFAPSDLALQYPECSVHAVVCYREQVERTTGPIDYFGALQAGLDRTAPHDR